MNTLLTLDATAQAALIKKGEVSPLELVDLSIAAIEKWNPTLNAVITPMFEEARRVAQSDLPDAPFKGVPLLLKDGIASYKGVPTSLGSALLKNMPAQQDSELVKRYKKAGFIILGKTNLPEFGLLPTTEPKAFGPSHNPWNTNKTPGGSSGGSAAAVAARLVALAHGNDGGGSIRIPASCCGLFGLKPTRGRNPLAPLGPLAQGLVAEHVLTHSVRDSAAVLDITGQPDPHFFNGAPAKNGSYLKALDAPFKKLKIGYSTESIGGGPLHKDCVKATLEAVELCKDLGHEVVEMPFKIPISTERIAEVFGVLWAVCAPSPIAVFKMMTGMDAPKELVEPLSYALYQQGKEIGAIDFQLAVGGMHQIARRVLEFFDNMDVWLSPTLGLPPVDLGNFNSTAENPLAPFDMASKFSPMTAIFNLSGQPAASVPTYWNAEGLPVGIQIVSQFGDETTLFQLAAQMEKVIKWQDNLPPMLVKT